MMLVLVDDFSLCRLLGDRVDRLFLCDFADICVASSGRPLHITVDHKYSPEKPSLVAYGTTEKRKTTIAGTTMTITAVTPEDNVTSTIRRAEITDQPVTTTTSTLQTTTTKLCNTVGQFRCDL
ncbi:unnamed protein product, partial [Mesorhabditis belari]|uniref:Uncharacterized protein n=1 Tax=Mesorhabditis belari TaxID=2138241 RepID=A0AAF3FIR3_9BILA